MKYNKTKKKFGDPILREQQERRLLMTRMTEINEKLFVATLFKTFYFIFV